MLRVFKWIGLVLVGIVAVCGILFAYYIHSPAAEVPHLTSAVEQATLKVGDRDRTYLSYVPSQLREGAPLVIVLHGSIMDGAMIRAWTGYEFDQLVDQKGFAVVYPDGYKRNWNDCRKDATFAAKLENVDDIGFIRALIARMAAEHHIDTHKVFVLGYSNGGHMAFRLAIEAPDEIATVAVAGASLPTPDASSCAESGRTSRVMLVDGTEDPINPYKGGLVTIFGFGSRGTALSAMASAEAIAKRNGVTGQPVAARMPHLNADDPTSVDSLIWGDSNAPVAALYTVNGGGHVVPQPAFRFPRLLGRTTRDLDAPLAALKFFGL